MLKSKFLKNILALLSITLVAGFALAFVNEVTIEPIAQAEENARKEAYNIVYPGAAFEEIENTDNLIEQSVQAIQSEGVQGCAIDDVLRAVDDNGNTIGYVMSAISPSGYGGDVKIALGISLEDAAITGFTVLSNSETAGLGAKCTDEDFTSQFAGKSADSIEYTKSGATNDTEIDAISGATITTRAVTDAVNSALSFYNLVLKEG